MITGHTTYSKLRQAAAALHFAFFCRLVCALTIRQQSARGPDLVSASRMFSVIQALVIQTSSVSMEVEQCVGCKALRLRGGWSPPVVRLHAWPLVAPMAAARLSRRELASWAACGAGAALAPRAAHAFAPPVGNVELLLPLLRCREIVAEQREAFAAVTLTLTLTLTAHRSPLTTHLLP